MDEALIGMIGTLLGTVLGWHLQQESSLNKEKKELFERKLACMRESRYILNSQLNFLKMLQKHIDDGIQVNNKTEEWQKVKIFYNSFKLIELKRESLFFLILDDQKLLDFIMMADAAYQSVLNMLEKRNVLYKTYEEVTQKIKEQDIEEIREAMGERLYGHLYNMTTFLIKENKDAVLAHEIGMKKIDEHLKNVEAKKFIYGKEGGMLKDIKLLTINLLLIVAIGFLLSIFYMHMKEVANDKKMKAENSLQDEADRLEKFSMALRQPSKDSCKILMDYDQTYGTQFSNICTNKNVEQDKENPAQSPNIINDVYSGQNSQFQEDVAKKIESKTAEIKIVGNKGFWDYVPNWQILVIASISIFFTKLITNLADILWVFVVKIVRKNEL